MSCTISKESKAALIEALNERYENTSFQFSDNGRNKWGEGFLDAISIVESFPEEPKWISATAYECGVDDATSKWIPVTEKTPCNWVPVIMAITDDGLRYLLMGWHSPEGFLDSNSDKLVGVEVTHWQPLPNLPNPPTE